MELVAVVRVDPPGHEAHLALGVEDGLGAPVVLRVGHEEEGAAVGQVHHLSTAVHHRGPSVPGCATGQAEDHVGDRLGLVVRPQGAPVEERLLADGEGLGRSRHQVLPPPLVAGVGLESCRSHRSHREACRRLRSSAGLRHFFDAEDDGRRALAPGDVLIHGNSGRRQQQIPEEHSRVVLELEVARQIDEHGLRQGAGHGRPRPSRRRQHRREVLRAHGERGPVLAHAPQVGLVQLLRGGGGVDGIGPVGPGGDAAQVPRRLPALRLHHPHEVPEVHGVLAARVEDHLGAVLHRPVGEEPVHVVGDDVVVAVRVEEAEGGPKHGAAAVDLRLGRDGGCHELHVVQRIGS
mmetsp:Transcript_59956/g.175925  ORF Transcript_59956/g.175925 Transcript_59956/m.175925 type:complete len:349 (-) Transcript_59956:384-1430(-)